MSDRLTEKQCEVMSQGRCPDCAHPGFKLGPRAGPAMNIECMGCHARFNVLHVSGAVAMAHRIDSVSDWPVSIHELHVVQAIVLLLPDDRNEGLRVLEQARTMVERFKRS